jgi:hypothetical protein
MIPSIDASVNVTLPPTRIVNANMPQPPPSTLRALMPLAVSSYTNEHLDSNIESKEDDSENQQRLISQRAKSSNIVEPDGENDYPINMPPVRRQSARIQKSKRTYTTSDSSARKKKKK